MKDDLKTAIDAQVYLAAKRLLYRGELLHQRANLGPAFRLDAPDDQGHSVRVSLSTAICGSGLSELSGESALAGLAADMTTVIRYAKDHLSDKEKTRVLLNHWDWSHAKCPMCWPDKDGWHVDEIDPLDFHEEGLETLLEAQPTTPPSFVQMLQLEGYAHALRQNPRTGPVAIFGDGDGEDPKSFKMFFSPDFVGFDNLGARTAKRFKAVVWCDETTQQLMYETGDPGSFSNSIFSRSSKPQAGETERRLVRVGMDSKSGYWQPVCETVDPKLLSGQTVQAIEWADGLLDTMTGLLERRDQWQPSGSCYHCCGSGAFQLTAEDRVWVQSVLAEQVIDCIEAGSEPDAAITEHGEQIIKNLWFHSTGDKPKEMTLNAIANDVKTPSRPTIINNLPGLLETGLVQREREGKPMSLTEKGMRYSKEREWPQKLNG